MSTPYSRVYWSIVDKDPKFSEIYPDNDALATWLRLLILADGAHPAAAPIPRRLHKPSFQKLIDAGIVDLLPNDCYRIHGLQRERDARSNAARNAAASRWRIAGGNAPASGPAMLDEPRRAEPSRDKTRQEGARDATASNTRETDYFDRDEYDAAIRRKWEALGLPVRARDDVP